MRILYVEDNEVNQALVERVLRAKQCSVVFREEGEGALEVLENDTDIDLILLDIELAGVMSGLDVIRTMRARNDTRPVVAITAYAMMGDRERFLEAGCDQYLPKPLVITDLLNLLDQYEADFAAKAAGVTAPPQAKTVPTPASPAAEPAVPEAPAAPEAASAPAAPAASAAPTPVVPEPATKSVAETATKPAIEPAAKPAIEPPAKPAAEPPASTAQTTATPVAKPAVPVVPAVPTPAVPAAPEAVPTTPDGASAAAPGTPEAPPAAKPTEATPATVPTATATESANTPPPAPKDANS